jgi:hypothetical protein
MPAPAVLILGRWQVVRSLAAYKPPAVPQAASRKIRPDGKATGTPVGRSVKVHGTTFTAEVEPGTAQLITLTR